MIDSSCANPPLGASVTAHGVSFRLFAPGHKAVQIKFEDENAPLVAMSTEGDGYHNAECPTARAGDLYRYRLEGGEFYPDPYSRFQPRGPHGPSMIIDPHRYHWNDGAWAGLVAGQQVIYELHLGTFTEAGTYAAAAHHLQRLCDLGITCVEVMPVNEFVGRFGWGYDGVNWFAPFHHYGEPDDLRALIDCAHKLGLGVILDVVYNHFGHDGNYLPRFAADYLTDKIENPWGSAPNYASPAMRRLAIDNAAYWIREFHFDGLRLDAIQNIHDPQYPSLLSSVVSEAREAAGSRRIIVSAEDYLQRTPLLGRGDQGGAAIDHLWNDDFHHACRVALTGNHYGFFKNYRGGAQEILSSLKRGFLYQGQFDAWSSIDRGSVVRDEPLSSFVAFTQNHDAVANTLYGQRIQAMVHPGKYRAITAVALLGPQTPLIFMGQEFAAATPFAYFADYPSQTGSLWGGRKKEAAQFLQYQDAEASAKILDPCSIETVRASTLNYAQAKFGQSTLRLFTDLLALRRKFNSAVTVRDVDGALLTDQAFIFRWFEKSNADRILLVNLGPQVECRAWAEPLLAAPLHRRWEQIWSSDSVDYDGMGTISAVATEGWQMSADSACLLIATKEGAPS